MVVEPFGASVPTIAGCYCFAAASVFVFSGAAVLSVVAVYASQFLFLRFWSLVDFSKLIGAVCCGSFCPAVFRLPLY